MMQELLNNDCNQLIREREVIRGNINQLSRLSEEFTNLSGLQNSSLDLTSYQSNLVNSKRINLRHNLVDLKDGLQIHYSRGEEVLRPLVGLLLLETLIVQHQQILKKLSEINAVILSLSPVGMLFNSIYLKLEIDTVCLVIYNLNCQENSLLSFSGICRNEEPF